MTTKKQLKKQIKALECTNELYRLEVLGYQMQACLKSGELSSSDYLAVSCDNASRISKLRRTK